MRLRHEFTRALRTENLHLKSEPQSGLVLPLRIMGVDRGDRSVRSWAGVHVGIREAELRVIEGIEGFKAELQSQSLELNVLEEREIEIRNSRRT